MKNIEVAMERTQRMCKTYSVPDSVYEEIKRTKRLPDDMFDDMIETMDDSVFSINYDYSVWSESEYKEIIEWEHDDEDIFS